MTASDLVVLVVVVLAAVAGLRAGLIASGLSVAGVVGGAILGARLAPHLLGGSSSPYAPLVGLVGALVLAVFLQTVAAVAGAAARRSLHVPPLRAVDSLGGLALGALAGLAFVWVVGATALLIPGQTRLRQEAQQSRVVRQLNELVPPRRLLDLLARVDPLPAITGPPPPSQPPDPAVLGSAAVRAAARSVFRVVGTACGLGVEGSGWAARRDLVVTAAHVVAGEHDTTVDGRAATAVAFDARNDIALLRVPGLDARPLPIADARPGTSVAVLGYPEDGPFAATSGRIGRTAVVLGRNAYGHGPVTRAVTSIRASIRHGNSGGPAVDGDGDVETTVFAARIGAEGGFGVPSRVVRRAIAGAREPVSTGDCAS